MWWLYYNLKLMELEQQRARSNEMMNQEMVAGTRTGRSSSKRNIHSDIPAASSLTQDEDVARYRLSKFVERMAHDITRRTGMRFEESNEAPADYEAVRAEYFRALNGKPFRVDKANSETSVYINQHTNWCMRFWHDYLHAHHCLDFSFDGELAVCRLHVDAVSAEFGASSLEAKIMSADTYGHTLYFYHNQGYVQDQSQYTLGFARVLSH